MKRLWRWWEQAYDALALAMDRGIRAIHDVILGRD